MLNSDSEVLLLGLAHAESWSCRVVSSDIVSTSTCLALKHKHQDNNRSTIHQSGTQVLSCTFPRLSSTDCLALSSRSHAYIHHACGMMSGPGTAWILVSVLRIVGRIVTIVDSNSRSTELSVHPGFREISNLRVIGWNSQPMCYSDDLAQPELAAEFIFERVSCHAGRTNKERGAQSGSE